VIFGMKPGQVSDVIAGEQGRFWILKLVDRREVQGATFEQVKPRIVSVLERQKLEKARTAMLEELRKKADVVYSSPPPKSSGN
jgi:parvulin-like peptidyl-prolyl isomerase